MEGLARNRRSINQLPPAVWQAGRRAVRAGRIDLHRGTGMDWKILATVFVSVFVAEMADKTQLVTLLYATDKAVSKWLVFFGSASALVATSAIGVLAGTLLSQFINVRVMSLIAGSGFILIGAWTLWHGLSSAP